MSIKLCALTDSAGSIKSAPQECAQCHTTSQVSNGLCMGCLLLAGLGSEETDAQDAEQTALETEVKHPPWRLGNYDILEEIGRGGMGVIYRARQRRSRRLVAIKRVLSHPVTAQNNFERFHLEAQAAASLDHPHILPIYDIGQCEDGLPFFSMKLAPGGSVEQAKKILSGMPRSCVALIAKVARAVQHAHREGILHRDLKPANILLDGDGEPLVTDFGLAKWLDNSDSMTRSMTSFGTPGYIAPEQASGKELTPAADVYSLGAILFDLLSGRPPFLGANALGVIQQAASTQAPKLRWFSTTADRDLETICAKCLEREPRLRYQSAGELAEDCERWLEGRSIVARPVSPPVRAWRWSRRNPVLAGSLAACALFAIFGATWHAKGQRLAAVLERRNLEDQSLAVVPLLDLDTVTTSSAASMALTNEFYQAAGQLGRLARTTPPSRPWPNDYAAEARALGVRYLVLGTIRQTAEGRSCAVHWFDAREGRITRHLTRTIPQAAGSFSRAAVQHMLQEPGEPPATQEAENFGTSNGQARTYLAAGEDYYARQTQEALNSAILCARKAINADPGCAPAYRLLSDALGMRNAFGQDTTGDEGEASKAAAKAVELAPDSPAAAFAQIRPQMQSARYDDALAATHRTIELGLDLYRSAHYAAIICKSQGQLDRALRWSQLAQRIEARPGEMFSFIADILVDLGEDEAARRAYLDAIALLPDLPGGRVGLAELCLLRGDLVEASQLYNGLAAKFPTHIYTVELGAQLAFCSRDFVRAADLYLDLTKTDGTARPTFYGSFNHTSARGYALLKSGKAEEGLCLLDQAAAIDSEALGRMPGNPDLLYNIAATEAALGRTADALSHVEQANRSGLLFYRFMGADPRFDNIRDNIAFKHLVRTMTARAASFRHDTQTQYN